jgi:steroid delta-isomerase-like uncharacterized protein
MSGREVVERMVEAWNTDSTETLDELYHEDTVDHWGETTISGLDSVIEAQAKYREGFPDYTMELKHVVDGGDLVAHHWVITGTHEGEFNGIPPTGNEITYHGMAFHRIENDKIAESWWTTDRLRVLRDLGVVGSTEELAEEFGTE